MAIYKNSRFTNTYVYSDELNRDIVHLGIINEPKFQPSQDDLQIEIIQGDRLDLMAKRFYGDEALDWVILEANPQLSNPFDVRYGDIIRVPMPEKVRAMIE